MKTYFVFLILLLSSFGLSAIDKEKCLGLKKDLETTEHKIKEHRLQMRRSGFNELYHQKKKLQKEIEQNCVGINQKIENAFSKSNLISE